MKNKLASMKCTSIWSKDGKVCKVNSNIEYGTTVGTFTFSGYNPFPCYSMKSVYRTIEAWLLKNGWTHEPGGSVEKTYNVVSERTGEILHTTSEKKVYIKL